MGKTFISYARQDDWRFVQKLNTSLVEAGIDDLVIAATSDLSAIGDEELLIVSQKDILAVVED